MNRKLLTIAIALMIFSLAVGPVAATLPPTNPLPKGSGWNSVWQLLQDLQNQITALTTRVDSIESNPVHFGEWQYGEDEDEDYHINVVYTAPTDGFVLARLSSISLDSPDIALYLDTGDLDGDYVGLQGNVGPYPDDESFTLPVRAGDEWIVSTGGFTNLEDLVYEIYWLPLTS